MPPTVLVVGGLTQRAGRVVSTTWTVNEHVVTFVAESVAVQFTVVLPCGKKLPLGGTHTATIPGVQSSVTVGENVAVAPVGPVHSTTNGEVHSMAGARSTTVSTAGALVELPPMFRTTAK